MSEIKKKKENKKPLLGYLVKYTKTKHKWKYYNAWDRINTSEELNAEYFTLIK
jgi:hypothetical protein